MEKISRIIPGSVRTNSIDMGKERPVRPGVPTFGRPEGRADIRDRVTMSSLANTPDPQGLSNYRNTRESQRAAVVERISRDFFNTKKAAPAPEPVVEEPQFVAQSSPLEDLTGGEEISGGNEDEALATLLEPKADSEGGFSPIELRRQINFRPLAVDR